LNLVGKTKHCLSVWEQITDDRWILDTVGGYCIPFDEFPFQNKVPKEIPFNKEQWDIVENEVQELLELGAIVESPTQPDEFVSTIFIVPKPNGKFRPVINLKYLNEFVHYDHFKQETFKVVLDLIQKEDYLTSIDLEKAYFSIPIHPSFQKYLKFVWNGKKYAFVCLCFGLSSCPYVFTKVLKPVYSFFRQQSIRCCYYIDDSLTMNKDKNVCHENTMVMIRTLQSLGFTINFKKSMVIPSQRIVFFGFLLDTLQFKVFLTEEKIQKIIMKAEFLIRKEIVVIRDLASFIGLVISAFHAVLEAPLHYRCLEREKVAALNGTLDFDRTLCLSQESKAELQWWVQNVEQKNGKVIRHHKVDIHCRTDASLLGWGAVDLAENKHANGRWNSSESHNQINVLELLAIFYAMQSMYSNQSNVHIEIQSDNVSAVAYVNDMGGMTSKHMDSLARSIWEWCLERNIYLSAIHIPGSQNVEADFYSRNFSDSTEWMLKKDIFARICQQLFTPSIDLFASHLNTQMSKFVSWFPEPGSFHNNAFTLSWHDMLPYIFPPFNQIAKVINKIKEDCVEKAILIFPYWKAQVWFPMLMEMLICIPLRLPRHRDILVLPHSGETHPMAKKMTLIVAVLSGDPSKVRVFQDELQTSSLLHGGKEPGNNMTYHGGDGIFGVYRGIKIPLLSLK